jgi:hypothetical protein
VSRQLRLNTGPVSLNAELVPLKTGSVSLNAETSPRDLGETKTCAVERRDLPARPAGLEARQRAPEARRSGPETEDRVPETNSDAPEVEPPHPETPHRMRKRNHESGVKRENEMRYSRELEFPEIRQFPDFVNRDPELIGFRE